MENRKARKELESKWLLGKFIPQTSGVRCSKNNKNPETDTGVKAEDERSRAVSH